MSVGLGGRRERLEFGGRHVENGGNLQGWKL